MQLISPLLLTLCVTLCFALNHCPIAQAAEPAEGNSTPPNIVYIISDDHAWTDYGFIGHPQIETPHLDALAQRSAVFSRGYVPTALCRPALATLISGMYAHQHRISGNDPAVLPEMQKPAGGKRRPGDPPAYRDLREQLISQIDRFPTIPKLLAERRYLSHQSGKWWEGNFTRGGFTHGMTRGFPQPGGRHGDDGLTIGREGMRPVTEFIDQAVAEQKPFFLWYAPFMPHTPHTPPQRLFDKYRAKGIESEHVARYYAMVEWFDETCGELLDHLDRKELTDNTLVVYIADNGWIQQPGGPSFAPRSKQSANEGGTRQPTLFSWPGVIEPGDRGEQLCSSIDIMPTVLAAAGVEPPAALPGLNLLPILRTGKPTPRTEVFGESFAHDVAAIEDPEQSLLYRWVIEDRWKLLLTYDGQLGRYAKDHPRTVTAPQLFDLLADPHEDHNLAEQHPEVVARLAEKLQAWWPVTKRKTPPPAVKTSQLSRPNVLFVVIDDQNDWIGHLGRHPLARTPHLDGLAARGTTFLNAHCQAALCNPSRTSVLLGLRPSTTGIYGLDPFFRSVPELADAVTLPQHFRDNGYYTLTTGKVFHGSVGGRQQQLREFDEWGPRGGTGVRPPHKLIPPTPHGNNGAVDWGVFPHADEDKGDYQVASWVVERLKRLAAEQTSPAQQPFFLAAGFFLPHVPCYVSPEWIKPFPDDDSILPEFLADDRDDIPRFAWYLNWKQAIPKLPWVQAQGEWRNLVRSYLASTAFVDAQIGRVLDQLAATPLADNTIVVVWSDHGWHLGEKSLLGKNSLWEPATRVPLIFAGPGITAGRRCAAPVELLDLYPTLVDLCGLPPKPGLEGISLRPQLQNPHAPRSRPALTTQNPGNHAVRSDRYRYIRYADGSEEFYDLQADPHEWTNLAGRAEFQPHITEHRRWIPATDLPPVPGSRSRILTYDPATDTATWEGTPIIRTDPIPE